MIRKLRYTVLGTLIAALIVYVLIINGSHPSTPCTSRDCGTPDHVRRLLPAGSAQPRLRQDRDHVTSDPKIIKQDILAEELGVDFAEQYDAKKEHSESRTNIDEADTTSKIKLAGKADYDAHEYDTDLEMVPSKHSTNRASIQNSNKKNTPGSDIGDGGDGVADPGTDPVEGLLAGMQANKKQDQKQEPHKELHDTSQTKNRHQSSDVTTPSLVPAGNVTAPPRVVRECISGDVLGAVAEPLALRSLESDPLDPSATEETPRDRQKSFQRVFKTRAWGHGWDQNNKGLNASGMGSTLYWSQEIIATLHKVVDDIKKELGIARVTLLDVPCGDLVWMHRFLQTRDDIMYTGMDIVPELIVHHKRTYPAREYPQRRFIHADLVAVPEVGRYHVVLCRMMMQHLPYFDVYQVLQRISGSGSQYALMTSNNGDRNEQLHLENIVDNPGRFRNVNLEIPPYNLEPPVCLQRDGPPDVYQGWDNFIGLWKLPLQMHTECRRVHQNKWKDTPHLLYSCTRWKT